MSGPFELDRFEDAQDAGRAYETATRELRAAAKRSHSRRYFDGVPDARTEAILDS